MKKKPNKVFRIPKGQRFSRKKFIKKIPNIKIIHYLDGKLEKKKILFRYNFISQKHFLVRDVTFEAIRRSFTKLLANNLGKNYNLQLKKYPHLILRENKQVFGAGADRISQGMREAFGTSTGRAAEIRKGDVVYELGLNKELNFGKELISLLNSKIFLKLKIEEIKN